MTTQFIGVREFRQNMTQLYKKAQKSQTRYVVLNKNKPVFEVRPIGKQERILENLLSKIEVAEADIKAGRIYTLDEIGEDLGLA